MLPDRVKVSGPTVAVSVPAIEASVPPNAPSMLSASCPPSTGVANV
jgi:hypothetical protein